MTTSAIPTRSFVPVNNVTSTGDVDGELAASLTIPDTIAVDTIIAAKAAPKLRAAGRSIRR